MLINFIWIFFIISLFLNKINATENLSVLNTNSLASCGRNSVPYSITIDINGHPELFCETPSCFEHTKKSNKINDDLQTIDNDNFNREFFSRRRFWFRHRLHRRATPPLKRFAVNIILSFYMVLGMQWDIFQYRLCRSRRMDRRFS